MRLDPLFQCKKLVHFPHHTSTYISLFFTKLIQIFQTDAGKLSSNELPKCLQQTFCLIAAKGTKEIDKLLETYRGIEKICENTPNTTTTSPNMKTCHQTIQDFQQLEDSYNFGLNVSDISECNTKYSCQFPAAYFEVSPVSKRVNISLAFSRSLKSSAMYCLNLQFKRVLPDIFFNTYLFACSTYA